MAEKESKEGRDRRRDDFLHKLALRMLWIAAVGAFVVLIDPRMTFPISADIVVQIGSKEGFSPDLKGAVVSLILIGGFTAVKEFFFGSSAGREKQGEALSRIAEAVPAAVAPAPETLKTNRVDVVADTASITERKDT